VVRVGRWWNAIGKSCDVRGAVEHAVLRHVLGDHGHGGAADVRRDADRHRDAPADELIHPADLSSLE
jgi:hypothetical protein